MREKSCLLYMRYRIETLNSREYAIQEIGIDALHKHNGGRMIVFFIHGFSSFNPYVSIVCISPSIIKLITVSPYRSIFSTIQRICSNIIW